MLLTRSSSLPIIIHPFKQLRDGVDWWSTSTTIDCISLPLKPSSLRKQRISISMTALHARNGWWLRWNLFFSEHQIRMKLASSISGSHTGSIGEESARQPKQKDARNCSNADSGCLRTTGKPAGASPRGIGSRSNSMSQIMTSGSPWTWTLYLSRVCA